MLQECADMLTGRGVVKLDERVNDFRVHNLYEPVLYCTDPVHKDCGRAPPYQNLDLDRDMVRCANVILSLTFLSTLHPKRHHDAREEAG